MIVCLREKKMVHQCEVCGHSMSHEVPLGIVCSILFENTTGQGNIKLEVQ